jgi:hypothetical protein
MASPGRNERVLDAPEQLPLTIGFRGPADHIVHSDLAFKALQIEEYPIAADAQAELGWLVSQGP